MDDLRPGRISLGLVTACINHFTKGCMSRRRSLTRYLPPGFNTRRISLNTAPGSAHSWSDPFVNAPSNRLSSKGILLASPFTYSTLWESPYSPAFLRPISIMAGLISTAFRDVPVDFFSHSRPRYPGPGPTSSARPWLMPALRISRVSIHPLSLMRRIIWSYILTSKSPCIPSPVSMILGLTMATPPYSGVTLPPAKQSPPLRRTSVYPRSPTLPSLGGRG